MGPKPRSVLTSHSPKVWKRRDTCSYDGSECDEVVNKGQITGRGAFENKITDTAVKGGGAKTGWEKKGRNILYLCKS